MSLWNFWIDRGGTFTDIIAQTPSGKIKTKKILSENKKFYDDSIIFGIKGFMNVKSNDLIPSEKIETIKIGTTVGTNALLEKKGERVVLITTKGFKDQLDLAYQNRSDIFAREVKKSDKLYCEVVEARERILSSGVVHTSLDKKHIKKKLIKIKKKGINSCSIVLMHSYKNGVHENQIFKIAKKIGFLNISCSHRISQTIKFVKRGDTTVLDAYLSPVLKKYINKIKNSFDYDIKDKCQFMKSDGGLVFTNFFHGKDSILSGPAGGVVGAIDISKKAGENKIIGFDMGGTSTDVCHYSGSLERVFDSEVNGIRISIPSININTVASGGGSKLYFKNETFKVGPDSVGAFPGPTCYGNGGDLALTDANLITGRLNSKFFPNIFGPEGKDKLNVLSSKQKFSEEFSFLKKSIELLAEGFLKVANENMANAIKKVSTQKGYNISDYCLTVFGGAGGQHACSISEILGIKKCLIHRYSSLLSAYGVGVAELRFTKSKSIEKKLKNYNYSYFLNEIENLKKTVLRQILKQNKSVENIIFEVIFHLKFQYSDTTIQVKYNSLKELEEKFNELHKKNFGFLPELREVFVDNISVEGRAPFKNKIKLDDMVEISKKTKKSRVKILSKEKVFFENNWLLTNFINMNELENNCEILGPSVIVNDDTSIVVNPGWSASLSKNNFIILKYLGKNLISEYDKNVMIEVYNNSYMSIAEQMGIVLEKTAKSVTIKERLDFSCAIFDSDGSLIANAPHIPVHLGSMDYSIKSIINNKKIFEGDFYAINDPYNGGTHLPDITVMCPVYFEENDIIFYVASRGHHTDVGGISPGSMPSNSKSIEEEGILIKNWLLVSKGEFKEKETRKLFSSGKYPARSIDLNIADLKAQIAACEKGVNELKKLLIFYGVKKVKSYLKILRNNANNIAKNHIKNIIDRTYIYKMDDGLNGEKRQIKVSLSFDKKKDYLTIDFSGTSNQQNNNFNAPKPVTKAAIIYSLRLLTAENIPINAGFMDSVKIKIPPKTMLSPVYPAPVTAGNVETSQAVTSAILLALKIQAASQSTMNNISWGNEKYQYYETICGGTGAGINKNGKPYNGTSGIQSHMTNSRLTDPEILELRFPVIIQEFSIRKRSGGKGRFFGGNGVLRKIKFLEKMKLSILSGHRKRRTPGLDGGKKGKIGKNYIIRKNGQKEKLVYASQSLINKGDVLIIKTPGGGGYGKT